MKFQPLPRCAATPKKRNLPLPRRDEKFKNQLLPRRYRCDGGGAAAVAAAPPWTSLVLIENETSARDKMETNIFY